MDDVVITGQGCVSPLGGDVASTWARLLDGENARGPLGCIPVEGCRVTQGAEAALPDLDWLSQKEIARLSRASRLALPAAQEALRDAGLCDVHGRSRVARL
ncbi:MAG: beta-ketoacyl synthase N-terminal-like domain-containing protein, partial [Terrimicrobiaceae bacterium]